MITPTQHTYQTLQEVYRHFNEHLFEGKLPECLITLQREKSTYGYFSAQRFVHRDGQAMTDEIALNPSYFAVVDVREILQTIAHEMVHLWQHHFGDPGRRRYHNRQWAEKMQEIGLMPSHTGQPGGRTTGEKMSDYAIEGGRFMQVCERFVEKGKFVEWLDRFPPSNPTRGGRTAITPIAEIAQSLVLGPDACDEGEAPKPSDKSNRVKQRCPSCGAQAWGKPTLKLLCGEPECDAMPLVAAQDDRMLDGGD